MRFFGVLGILGLLMLASPAFAEERKEALVSEDLTAVPEPEMTPAPSPAAEAVPVEAASASQCLANIKKEKGKPCASASPSYSCLEAFKSDAVKNYCSQHPANTAIELQEVFNPKNQNVKSFSTSAELLPFLDENPDYQPRPCYCCC